METENNRKIKKWLSEVEDKTLALPEFQRRMVWDYEKCESLLEAIIQKNPIGVFLLLEIDSNNPPFEIRFIEGADVALKGQTTFLLLDGQQRITSLFRAFNENNEQNVFYVKFKISTTQSIEFDGIQTINRGTKSTAKIIGQPQEECKKNYIPATILNPTAGSNLINDWIGKAELVNDTGQIKEFCEKIKKTISDTIIPHFHLERMTSPESAIDIYLKLNTQSVVLTPFYEAVGKMYSETKPRRSLLKIIQDLELKVPLIRQMESTDPDNLFLKVACLKQNKTPTEGSYKNLNFTDIYRDRKSIINGIKWAVNFMNGLGINKGKQLPSSIPLRVLPAIHKSFESQPDSRKSTARKIINRYVWHAFFTRQYEKSANTRLKKDFDEIKRLIEANRMTGGLEIFKLDAPSKEDVEKARWPGNKEILGRAVLLACQLDGAVDVETGSRLSYPNEEDWNLDHIFPRAKLRKIGIYPNRALNYMLLKPATNKRFSDDLPGMRIKKLQDRVRRETGEPLPDQEIKKRYGKQLVSTRAFNILLSLDNEDISDEDLKSAYHKFIDERAKSVKKRIEKLLKDGEL